MGGLSLFNREIPPATIRERRRRRLEAAGQPFVEWGRDGTVSAMGGRLSVAETLKLRRQRVAGALE
jgi:hypothetical protein